MNDASSRPGRLDRDMMRRVTAADIDEVLARLSVAPDDPIAAELRALAGYVIDLGAGVDEIVAAASVGGLGPLALDHSIRTPGSAATLEEFLATSGLDRDLVSQLWLALGLPEDSSAPFPVTPDLAEALRVLALLTAGFSIETVLGFCRVIGSSAERIADALASATRVGIEVPQRDGGMQYVDIVREYSSTARDLLPVLWDAVGAVFRRHLVLVSYEGFDLEKSQHAVTLPRAIGFIDLVGSTDLHRTLSVADLAQAVNRFERLVGDRVTRAGGRVVKLIGDEAMFAFADLRVAIETCLDLIEATEEPVRAGLAFGDVIAMHGDYFGPTVNLAARLVAIGAPSTLLTSESARRAADGLFEFDEVETGPLRGFPEVTTAYAVRPR